MRVRVGINGFSPTGRAVLRALVERDDVALEVVAINDPVPARTLAHLLQHDSPHGRWNVEIGADDEHLSVANRVVRVGAAATPDWHALDVAVVIDTGDAVQARQHLDGGARKVVLTTPGTGPDATVVMGLNEDTYSATEHHLVSAGSAAAPRTCGGAAPPPPTSCRPARTTRAP